MIIILKNNAEKVQVEKLRQDMEARGMIIHESRGQETTLWGLVGDTSQINEDQLMSNKAVEAVRRIQEPYKAANRKFHPEDSVVDIGGKKIKTRLK